jgi:hypothetical protein
MHGLARAMLAAAAAQVDHQPVTVEGAAAVRARRQHRLVRLLRRLVALLEARPLLDTRPHGAWAPLLRRQRVHLCLPLLHALRLVDSDGRRAEVAATDVACDKAQPAGRLRSAFVGRARLTGWYARFCCACVHVTMELLRWLLAIHGLASQDGAALAIG